MSTAAFDLIKYTGTNAGTPNDSLYNPCFLDEDSNSTETGSRSIAVPTTGSNYSYEVSLALKCILAPNNQCNNFKFWGANTQPATGIIVYAGVSATGSTPTNSPSVIAITRQDTNYISSGLGEYLTIPVVPGDSIINAVDEETYRLVLQMQVLAGAFRGNVPTMIFYLEYDEA